MARLIGPASRPLRIVAELQQGVAIDLTYGLALDGLLAAAVRHRTASATGQRAGAAFDGGSGGGIPAEYDVPLGRCPHPADSGQPDLWHWLATVGLPVGPDGQPSSLVPDPHRLLGDFDEVRAAATTLALPANIGGARGRYRRRIAPVLTIPASAVVWHAVGDADRVEELLRGQVAVGARRGSGEGAVLSWRVEEVPAADAVEHGHLHPDGRLGRAVPVCCAQTYGFPVDRVGRAGLRPPMFHPVRQHLLVLPAAAREGGS